MPKQLPAWDQSLTVNNPAIDQQHRELIALITDLPGKEDAAFDMAIKFLLRYTFEHFTGEERWMKAQHYPHIEQHIDLHRSLAAEFDRHFHNYLAKRIDHLEFIGFLHTWVTQHILEEDRKFARFLAAADD
jgi:hemerythrin